MRMPIVLIPLQQNDGRMLGRVKGSIGGGTGIVEYVCVPRLNVSCSAQQINVTSRVLFHNIFNIVRF